MNMNSIISHVLTFLFGSLCGNLALLFFQGACMLNEKSGFEKYDYENNRKKTS